MFNIFKVIVLTIIVSLTSIPLSINAEPPKKAPAKDEPLPKVNIPQHLLDISATIRTNRAEGSGSIKQTKDGQVWIWTCGHVVADLRRLGPNGKVLFDDAKVVRIDVEDGRTVGQHVWDAQVIRYSHAEKGEDLALLRLRSKRYKPADSVKFHLGKEITSIGTELYHCGSLLGEVGSNSLTSGIMSQHGRLIFEKIFDQASVVSFPGSSGGGVARKSDGKYVGMVVRGAGEGFTLMVPVRRMYEWAKKVEVDFTMDDSLAVPSDEKLLAKPIDDAQKENTKEEIPAMPNAPHGTNKSAPTVDYRIRYLDKGVEFTDTLRRR